MLKVFFESNNNIISSKMDENELEKLQNNGIFRDPQTDQEQDVDDIPLHILLSFPLFWKSSRIISFLEACLKYIKQNKDNNDLKQFFNNLRRESELALPPGNSDWSNVLGKDDWEILQKGSRYTDTKSVDELVRLIRNQLHHIEERTNEKRALGWFCNKNFNETQFINYWVKKFPKLVSFLWWKFYNQQDLQQFYLHSLDHYDLDKLDWNKETIISDLVQHFNRALETHLLQGELLQRYNCCTNGNQSTSYHLEIRCLDSRTLNSLLEGCSHVKILIENNSISFTWTDLFNNGVSNEFSHQYFYNNEIILTVNQKLLLLITTNIVAKEAFKIKSSGVTKVILFVDKSNKSLASEIIKTFASSNNVTTEKNQITWKEVLKFQTRILRNGQVALQGYNHTKNRTITLQEILPADTEAAADILEKLSGSYLNAFLKNRTLNLYCKHKIPALPSSGKYLGRRMCSRKEISSKVLRHRSSDIFLVMNMSLYNLKSMINPTENVHLFETAMNTENPGDFVGRIFLVKNSNNHDYNQMVADFRQRFPHLSHPLHIICYFKDDLFQWLYSYGSMDIILRSFPKKASDSVTLSEDNFLKNIVQQSAMQNRPIFILDKPDMGKSLLIKNLANKIHRTYSHSITIFLNMNDEFVTKLGKAIEKSKSTIKSAIVEIIKETLCENSEFEIALLEHWLSQQNCCKFTFELMLDGLDEVEKKYKQLAIEILKIITKELPTIRLWVTCREYMQSEIERKFSNLCYKIQSFSEEDMVKFLTDYWVRSAKKNEDFKDTENLEEILNRLAKHCVSQTNVLPLAIDIAGAPLQCQMIAEIYDDNLSDIISGKLIAPEKKSLTAMYKYMVNKKLRHYLAEKKKVPNLGDDDDMVETLRDEMIPWHMYYSIKLLFPDWQVQTMRHHFNVTEQNSSKMESTASSYGIVENLDPPRLIHRTFAEYFVALFICRVLNGHYANFNGSEMQLIEAFDGVKQQYSHECNTQTSINISKPKLPAMIYFLNEMLAECDQISQEAVQYVAYKMHDFNSETKKFETSKSIILTLMQDNHFHLAKVLIEALNQDTRNMVLEKTKNYHTLFFDVLIRNSDVVFFKYIYDLLKSWNESFVIQTDTFLLALKKGNFSIAKYLIENHGFNPEKWQEIRTKDKKSLGVIHHVIGKSRHDSDVILENKRQLLQYLVELDVKPLEQKDHEDRTPILMPPISISFQLKKFLIETLGANVNAIGKFKNSVLHWKCCTEYGNAVSPSVYHEMLEFYLSHGFNAINLVSNMKWTPLMCAVKTYEDSLLPETLELFRDSGADFNAIDDKGKTVRDVCISRNCKPEFIQRLIDCGARDPIDPSEE